tara:strand:- start:270 stop:560 length:291 start_codon:yes stop_codon:yes gene_type:complete
MPRHNLDEAPDQTLAEQKADKNWEERKKKEEQEFKSQTDKELSQFLSSIFWLSLGLLVLGVPLVFSGSSLFYILGLGLGALGHLGLVYWALIFFFR